MDKKMLLVISLFLGAALVGLAFAQPAQAVGSTLTKTEQLGKMLFFDQNLSLNNNQACAACHAPEVGFTGPSQAINLGGGVYEGSIPGAFGNRKPPAAAYAGYSPNLHYDAELGTWVGGMFWDGRATGATLGDPLAEQAKGPFLNPKEQAIPDAKALCEKVQASSYAALYEEIYGTLDCAAGAGTAYNNFAFAIAAYERSTEVTAFTSKFDAFWMNAQAKGLDVAAVDMTNWTQYNGLGLNGAELRGMALFNSKALCSGCHSLEADAATGRPLFTDYTYDNLGLPKNPKNPETIAKPDWADPGLGGYLESAGKPASVYSTEIGKFKVPTLRNVDKRPAMTMVKAFGHNGYFKSLEEIVHFYNTRDVAKAGWPAPETSVNMNTTEIGNLGLTKGDETQIVMFLKTLTDGYMK